MEHTLYINLISRPDRNVHARTQFNLLNVSAERVNAIEHENGAIGCTLSHIYCLEYAIQHNWPQVCICEDDILFTNPPLFTAQLSTFLKKQSKWDVLLVGANIAPPFIRTTDYCMQVYNAQTTTGYIVKQHYYNTLLLNFKTGLSKLLETNNTPHYAIDIFWKHLQFKDRWYILTPLSVVQKSGYSNIENKLTNYETHMLSDKSI
jgi:glycosyl transferase family 25